MHDETAILAQFSYPHGGDAECSSARQLQAPRTTMAQQQTCSGRLLGCFTKCIPAPKPEPKAKNVAQTPSPASPKPKADCWTSPAAAIPFIGGPDYKAVIEKIDTLEPEELVSLLRDDTMLASPEVAEQGCRAMRVLGRKEAMCLRLEYAGAALAISAALVKHSASPSVQLQALAALVNFCAGEMASARQKVVEAGGLPLIVAAMNRHKCAPPAAAARVRPAPPRPTARASPRATVA